MSSVLRRIKPGALPAVKLGARPQACLLNRSKLLPAVPIRTFTPSPVIHRQESALDPFDSFFRDPFFKSFGGFFDTPLLSRDAAGNGNQRAFDVDIVTKENEYAVSVDLPGVKKDDIKVHLKQNPDGRKYITIAADRKDEVTNEDKERGFYSERRSFSSVSRSFQVPRGVEMNDIKVKHSDGVLHLSIPRQTEAKLEAQSQQLTIE